MIGWKSMYYTLTTTVFDQKDIHSSIIVTKGLIFDVLLL